MIERPKISENPGSVLSDQDIKRALEDGIIGYESPYPPAIQPASLDVRLAPRILTFARRRIPGGTIDLKKPVDEFMEEEVVDSEKGCVIQPHEFILGVTREWLSLPNFLIANVDGKSSLGRVGIVVHATAGFIDPGFSGHVTLEITNLTEMPVIIYPEIFFAQIRFTVLSSPALHPYGDASLGSKQYPNPYSDNPAPIPSQYYKNFRT